MSDLQYLASVFRDAKVRHDACYDSAQYYKVLNKLIYIPKYIIGIACTNGLFKQYFVDYINNQNIEFYTAIANVVLIFLIALHSALNWVSLQAVFESCMHEYYKLTLYVVTKIQYLNENGNLNPAERTAIISDVTNRMELLDSKLPLYPLPVLKKYNKDSANLIQFVDEKIEDIKELTKDKLPLGAFSYTGGNVALPDIAAKPVAAKPADTV